MIHRKTTYCLTIAVLFLSACISIIAAGILSDQKGIKSSEELTGNLSFLVNADGDVLISTVSTYVDHVHVFQVGTSSTLRFFDQDTLPCTNANLMGIVPITIQGEAPLLHRFNEGVCMRQTSTSPATVRVHYNIE